MKRILHCPLYGSCEVFLSIRYAIFFAFTMKSDFIGMIILNTIPLEFFSSH